MSGHDAAKFLAICRTSFLSRTRYVGEIAVRSYFVGLTMFVLGQLWLAVYGRDEGSRLLGLSLPQMLWYLALTESFVVSRPMTSVAIEREIRTGEIVYLLVRPVSYLFQHCAVHLGERVIRLAINLAVSAAVAAALTGTVAVSIPGSVAYLPAVVLAMLIDFAGVFLVGAAAFWIDETMPLYWMYQRAMMLLGGMLFPLDIFPRAAARVLKWLPFSFAVYGPAAVAVDFSPDLFGRLLVGGVVTCIAMMAVAWWVLTRGVRRLEARGG